MTARDRRGLRLGLLVVAAASVALAIIGWSLWPLGGLIVPAVALWVIRPQVRERPEVETSGRPSER